MQKSKGTSGDDAAAVLSAAWAALRAARTADELRRAQALLLPATLGLSVHDTALVIGRSIEHTSRLRVAFWQELQAQVPHRTEAAAPTRHDEAWALDVVFSKVPNAAAMPVKALHPIIEKALQRTLSPSTVNRMLARHGWRKVPERGPASRGSARVPLVWRKVLVSRAPEK